jgi:hypothetical protein
MRSVEGPFAPKNNKAAHSIKMSNFFLVQYCQYSLDRENAKPLKLENKLGLSCAKLRLSLVRLAELYWMSSYY